MTATLTAVALLGAALVAWFIWRSRLPSKAPGGNGVAAASVAEADARLEFPPQGLLVSEEVLRSAGSTSAAIWTALEEAAVPVAFEYYPVFPSDIAKYRAVPVNASVQQAMVNIVEAINPKGPTLFRAVLPKGAELVRAVGADGFRGFSRTGGTTAHAVLKPVAAGGALAAGWPVLAVAGTVMAVDMVAQREQRAHQRRVEASLLRQEERQYVDRIKDQRSADAQLTRAISEMLDGLSPQLELALKSADDEFYRSQQFLDKYREVIVGLVAGRRKVDFRKLDLALGGATKEVQYFVRDLHLARAAVAIQRKAIVAYAASLALKDPGNPYTALKRVLDGQVSQLEEADATLAEMTKELTRVEFTGSWHHRDSSLSARQKQFREQVALPTSNEVAEVLYLATDTGEVLQLLPAEEPDDGAPTFATGDELDEGPHQDDADKSGLEPPSGMG